MRVAGLWMALGLTLWGGQGAAMPPQRVISLNLCTDQLAMLLAAPDQLLGVSWLARDPQVSAMVQEAGDLPTLRGQAEEVYALAPDLVLLGDFVNPTSFALLQRLAVPMRQIAPPRSLADIPRHMREVGAALGRSDQAEAMVTDFNAALAARSRPSVRLRAAFYHPNGYTSGAETLGSDLLDRAGFDNLATDLALRPDGVLPLEVLLAAEPDLIITPSPYPGASNAEALLDHPGLHKADWSPLHLHSTAKWSCGLPQVIEALDDLRAAHIQILREK